MGTQRFISTSFWDDPWIRKLTPDERYMFLYLMTNTLTNIAGVYQITMDRICYDTGYSTEKVKQIINLFEKSGKAYFYQEEFMVLPKWPKHQRWETSGKIKAGIEAILKNLSPELLGFIKKIGYTYPIDALCIPYVYPSSYSDSDSDSDSDRDSDLNLSTQPETPVPQDSPTACAVDQKEIVPVFQNPEQTKIAHVSTPPPETKKRRGITLTYDQKPLFHAAKACFEADEKTKALMYQDRGSTQMYMENLKLFVVRCHNIAPGITADFMKTVLDHFKVLCGGRLKGRVEFTPSALITRWIWETVIGSLPKADDELTEKIRQSIKGMFK